MISSRSQKHGRFGVQSFRLGDLLVRDRDKLRLLSERPAVQTVFLFLLLLLLLVSTLESLKFPTMHLLAQHELLSKFVPQSVQISQRRHRASTRWGILLLLLLLLLNPVLQLRLRAMQLIHELLLSCQLLPHVVILAHQGGWVDGWRATSGKSSIHFSRLPRGSRLLRLRMKCPGMHATTWRIPRDALILPGSLLLLLKMLDRLLPLGPSPVARRLIAAIASIVRWELRNRRWMLSYRWRRHVSQQLRHW
jgi:hypothetical protein